MLLEPQAKINLGLHVVERRADGYHNIETAFYAIPLHDELEVKLLEGTDTPYSLQLSGQKVQGEAKDNLVVRTLEALRADFDIPPVDIWLHKRIPMGAGLGGGSSDAAAMACALRQLFDLPLSDENLEARMAKIGADCPFFVKAQPALATGIGDVLAPLDLSLRGWTLVLVKPAVSVPTKDAYAGITPRKPDTDLRTVLAKPVEQWRKLLRNDFEDSVFPQYPQIAAIKETLYDMGAVYAAMSGSGSAVFGLFRHKMAEAPNVFPDCYVFQSSYLQ